MKKVLITVLVFTGIIIVGSSFRDQQKLYKNLKILPKNISKTDLDSIMDSYTVALGVKCTFCHVKKGEEFDYASDDKGHKKVARDMMTMTNGINNKYFKEDNEGRVIPMVTCYTCHNGRKEPYFRPVKEEGEHK